MKLLPLKAASIQGRYCINIEKGRFLTMEFYLMIRTETEEEWQRRMYREIQSLWGIEEAGKWLLKHQTIRR